MCVQQLNESTSLQYTHQIVVNTSKTNPTMCCLLYIVFAENFWNVYVRLRFYCMGSNTSIDFPRNQKNLKRISNLLKYAAPMCAARHDVFSWMGSTFEKQKSKNLWHVIERKKAVCQSHIWSRAIVTFICVNLVSTSLQLITIASCDKINICISQIKFFRLSMMFPDIYFLYIPISVFPCAQWKIMLSVCQSLYYSVN